jgi:hypothetical protein
MIPLDSTPEDIFAEIRRLYLPKNRIGIYDSVSPDVRNLIEILSQKLDESSFDENFWALQQFIGITRQRGTKRMNFFFERCIASATTFEQVDTLFEYAASKHRVHIIRLACEFASSKDELSEFVLKHLAK